jgi:hypothetical protein
MTPNSLRDRGGSADRVSFRCACANGRLGDAVQQTVSFCEDMCWSVPKRVIHFVGGAGTAKIGTSRENGT